PSHPRKCLPAGCPATPAPPRAVPGCALPRPPLDAQIIQDLPIVVGDRIHLHLLNEPRVVPDFQHTELPHHVHFTLHLRLLAQHRRKQQSSLPVHLHLSPVIARAREKLLLGLVVRGELGQLLFDFHPLLHRVDVRPVPVLAGHVKRVPVHSQILQKVRRNLQPAFRVYSRPMVSPQQVGTVPEVQPGRPVPATTSHYLPLLPTFCPHCRRLTASVKKISRHSCSLWKSPSLCVPQRRGHYL